MRPLVCVEPELGANTAKVGEESLDQHLTLWWLFGDFRKRLTK